MVLWEISEVEHTQWWVARDVIFLLLVRRMVVYYLDWIKKSKGIKVEDENEGSDTMRMVYNQYVNQKITRNISVNISKTLGLEAIYPVRKMTFILNT